MSMIQEHWGYLFFLVVAFLFVSKHYKKITEYKDRQLPVALFFAFIFLILGIYPMMVWDIISIVQYNRILFGSLVFVFALIQKISIYLLVENIDKKKMQVMYKIPLAGFLVGLLFEESQYIPLICLGIYGVTLIFIFSKGEKYRYLIYKLLFLVPAVASMWILNINFMNQLSIVLVLLLFSVSPLIDLYFISSQFKKVSE